PARRSSRQLRPAVGVSTTTGGLLESQDWRAMLGEDRSTGFRNRLLTTITAGRAERQRDGGKMEQFAPAVRMLLDRAEIHDVMMRYAAGVDRRDFELVRACFAPEVTGWTVGREPLIDLISGVRNNRMTMH